jgi:inactivated superfamily I helicase
MDNFVYVSDDTDGLLVLKKHPNSAHYDAPKKVHIAGITNLHAVTSFKSRGMYMVVSLISIATIFLVSFI